MPGRASAAYRLVGCPVRWIIGANETNATLRFHRIRPGESWNLPDLDGYRQDKMVAVYGSRSAA